MSTNATVIDLADRTIILDPAFGAHVVEGGAAFWEALARGEHPGADEGRLVVMFDFDGDWSSWEMHPEGEELVILVAGRTRFVLETEDGERELELSRPGQMVVVPRGVWHTARTDGAARVLFVTAGKGTEHREAAKRAESGKAMPAVRYAASGLGVPSHIEFGALRGAPSAEFFGALFGWPIHAMQGDNFSAQTPSGTIGFHPDDDACNAVPYFDVVDLDVAMERVRALGGTVAEPSPEEGSFGRFVACTDPQGLPFGLHLHG